MKKLLIFILLFIMSLSFYSCSNEDNEIRGILNNYLEGKGAIVYFSKTGNTKAVCDKINYYLNLDMYELVEKEPYSERDLTEYSNDTRPFLEGINDDARVELKTNVDVTNYDYIFLATPIWYDHTPKIIYSFIDQNKLENKKIFLFYTSDGSDYNGAFEGLAKTYPDLNFYNVITFKQGHTDEDIKGWLKSFTKEKEIISFCNHFIHTLTDDMYYTSCTYSDTYFSSSFDNDIAKFSNNLAQSVLLKENESTIADKKDISAYQLLERIGYTDIELSEDYFDYDDSNKNGVMIGRKGNLVLVSSLGRKYFPAWVGNVNIGESGYHQGFDIASNNYLTFLLNYLEKHGLNNLDTKMIITGFSRAGGISNLVGAKLDQKIDNKEINYLNKDNIKICTFASPYTTDKVDVLDRYNNIFNIINPNDLFPKLFPYNMKRFGTDIMLFTSDNEPEIYASFKEQAASISGGELTIKDKESSRTYSEWANYLLTYVSKDLDGYSLHTRKEFIDNLEFAAKLIFNYALIRDLQLPAIKMLIDNLTSKYNYLELLNLLDEENDEIALELASCLDYYNDEYDMNNIKQMILQIKRYVTSLTNDDFSEVIGVIATLTKAIEYIKYSHFVETYTELVNKLK